MDGLAAYCDCKCRKYGIKLLIKRDQPISSIDIVTAKLVGRPYGTIIGVLLADRI
jgi:hypothetical protein